MKVNIVAGMCLVIAWSLISVGSGPVEPNDGNERARSVEIDNSDWRRLALNAIVRKSECAGGVKQGPTTPRPSIPPERLEAAFRRHFVPQTRTALKFARLLLNYLSSDGEPNLNRLLTSVVLSIVQSDRSISSCAVDITNERKPGLSLPFAYRQLAPGVDQDEIKNDAICVVNINDTVTVNNKSYSNNNNNNLNNNNHNNNSQSSSVDCAYHTKSEREMASVLDAMSDFRSRANLNATENNTKTMTSLWSSIFYDCHRNSWMATYSVGLTVKNRNDASNGTHNRQTNNSAVTLVRTRGVLTMTLDLSGVDLNQCGSADDHQHLFSGTSLCQAETMECVHEKGLGFRVGSYRCVCRARFYFPATPDAPHSYAHLGVNVSDGPIAHLDGGLLERESVTTTSGDVERLQCLPCHPGCDACTDGDPCSIVTYDMVFRGLPLGIHATCMTLTFFFGLFIFKIRKGKVIATGMWTVLEMILVGAVLLYSTIIIRNFEPNTVVCLMEPWFREMGFAIFYGTIILKLYRILVDFRTRKAHRWVVRDKDLLKYLAGIILTVIGYMSAWTAITADQIVREDQEMIVLGRTENGLSYHACKATWWNYVTEAGELAFLLFGIYISYHTQHATSPFNENRYLCLAIYIEASSSLALYAFRHFWWMSIHPDYDFLMYSIRCQLTVTVNLLLIFVPKIWCHYHPLGEMEMKMAAGAVGGGGGGGAGGERSSRGDANDGERMSGPELVKLQDGITSNGEVDIGEINLADMDPEDIRAELRRVYTQLQVLRNKTMRKDNPHISKRRGGRKATHRRFSLQAFHRHRQHHHEAEHETEISKTPEESTGSADLGASMAAAAEPEVQPAISRCSSVRK